MSDSTPPRETPIADHGLIGDLRTVALVSVDGTIDWFCPERFDAPSVFGAVLDGERGGDWRIFPVQGDARSAQFYFPDSNVLVTRLMNEDGVVELQDLMPVVDGQRIMRRVNCVRGHMRLRMVLAARFDYGRCDPEISQHDNRIVLEGAGQTLTLFSAADLSVEGDDVCAELVISEGETVTFVLHVGEREEASCHEPEGARELFDATVRYWRDWLYSSTYSGRWREMVQRSALTLKLLTYSPTGAIVAAPTTSLPEMIGGSRNWDYRYVWMRDAAFTVYALLQLGFTEEAAEFSRWTGERIAEHDGEEGNGPLKTMYAIDGAGDLDEIELDHLRGHADSQPVRVGNAAADQLQLDIYGELIDSIYLYDKYGTPISHDTWMALTGVVEWLCDNWDRPDSGIWESRDEPKDHTFSRLMCWVAIERMIRVARRRGLPADVPHWSQVRDAIYMQIMDRGWDEELGAFVGQLDQEGVLDASLLLMPMVKFCSPTDPRFISTLEAIERTLVADTLVYRYDPKVAPDGVDGLEGTFSICSFWYVEALTRVGRLEDARLALEKMFTYANHLGLYAEEVSATGEQRGNFPQAFTHFALISAAFNLDRALGED